MKRLLTGTLALATLFAATPARAQWEPGAVLLTANLGYASAEGRVNSETLHLGVLGASFDWVVPDEFVSFGIMVGTMTADENEFVSLDGNPPVTAEVRYNSSTVQGAFKGWFGGTRVRGYLGAGFGFHTSRLEISAGSDYRIRTATGAAFTIPGGLVWFFADEVYLNANAFVNFMGDSFYGGNSTYGGVVGLGFKI